MIDVGIVGVGTYLPEKTMKAAEIARLTNGVWSEDAVINKLGIKQRYLPGPDDGTQEMGAKAALKCLENTGVDPKEIDVILCIGEEWKEYPLTTSACYIQDRIGATNAWGIDVQNRCSHLRVRDENRRGYVESRRRNKYHYDLRRIPQRRLRGFHG